MATNYWDYIRVEDLLRLQGGLENDESELSDHEVVFITVHQVFELWFKLALRELTTLRDVFQQTPVPENAIATGGASMERIGRIFKAAVAHFEVVESINTRDYLDFRDKLFPASGFQSAQMREMEILLGLPDEERIGLGADGKYMQALKDPSGQTDSPAHARVEERLADTPTLLSAVGNWLHRTPIRGSQPGDEGDDGAVDAFLEDYMVSLQGAVDTTLETVLATGVGNEAAMRTRYAAEVAQAREFFFVEDRKLRRIRAAVLFIESYRELPLLSWPRKILAQLVEFEQSMIIFRQRHARMVERVIGRRIGTGGSSGVDYLDQTALKYRVFKDLWAVRTFQIPANALPVLEDTRPYEFNATFDV
ncbi:MAG: tryptophan 2,3-dioxygenase family protein [Planctomycetota bacterium]|nr:tryptophan 2,3-dioxygenase family protein [Planctomycetota bacterium]